MIQPYKFLHGGGYCTSWISPNSLTFVGYVEFEDTGLRQVLAVV